MHRQSVARISEEMGTHVIALYQWRKTWRLQGLEEPCLPIDSPIQTKNQLLVPLIYLLVGLSKETVLICSSSTQSFRLPFCAELINEAVFFLEVLI
jgi:hypothetical protein